MVVRICLILALLTSLGAVAVGLLKVKPRIEQTETDLASTKSALATEQSEKARVQGELATTKTTLETTKGELDRTKMDLATKTQEADAAQKQVMDVTASLEKEKTAHQTLISQNLKFVKLNMTVEQIEKTIADLKTRTVERDVFTKENKVLKDTIGKLQSQIVQLSPPTVKPKLPEGLTGKVISVDPKYDFVVLNIGAQNGVLSRGEMVISRDGQLVGKIEIAGVETDHCFANVIKVAGKKAEILEGDVALVQ
jgi:septal ring factor EnvC (AmiA/AmiB activator)